jgi:hypothetical protein
VVQSVAESIDPSGNKVRMSVTKMSLRDDKGELMGLVSTTRDITARKKAEEQLANTQKSCVRRMHSWKRIWRLRASCKTLCYRSNSQPSSVSLCQRRVRCDFTISLVPPQPWAVIFSRSFRSPTPSRECLFVM